jgi:S-DNA-T family DNA segregation ATPase FtsK/SpoIIIE
LWDEMREQEARAAGQDELLEQAIELVREHKRASISLLQRKLRIGYLRASRLIDTMEDMEIVGPTQGGGRGREVLVPEDPVPTSDTDQYSP